MDPRLLEARLTLTVVTVLGVVGAVTLGICIGSDEWVSVLAVFGAAAIVALVLRMQSYVWVFIPLAWFLTGRLGFLPLPFSVRELAVLLAAAVFLTLMALRGLPLRTRTTAVDLLLYLNLAYVMFVYARHPVGVAAFGSSMVGGRPYFDALIGFLAYFVLSRSRMGPKLALRLPALAVIPSALVSLLGLIGYLFPGSLPYIAYFYGGIDVSSFFRDLKPAGAADESVDRIFDLATGARACGVALASYFDPFSLINPLRPARCLGFLACFAAMGLAGFRNGILFLVCLFALSAFVRHGFSKLVQLGAVLALMLLLLCGLQAKGVHLPVNVQRALSFLPGKWDPEAVSDAETSVDWRVYMWRTALSTSDFIKDKVFGDGFGFSAYELSIMQSGQDYIGHEAQEVFMIQGAFHSGPISAVRFVGVVGLMLYLALLVYLAVHGFGLLRVTMGSPYFPIAMMTVLPALYEPFQYVFIFGGYDSGLPTTLFTCGLFKLVENNFAAWNQVQAPHTAVAALDHSVT
ncbi:MAG: hypothetical protein JO015_08590 [Verrucomicrobia bacterium]|nr:hypothetical protein [Verrucomicrobiota bacterium]